MAIPVMFFVALFVFLLLRLTPGDPAQAIAGDQATPAQLAAIRENLGLDKPLAGQFATWLADMAGGDFGHSLISQRPVLEMIGQRVRHRRLERGAYVGDVPLGKWRDGGRGLPHGGLEPREGEIRLRGALHRPGERKTARVALRRGLLDVRPAGIG